MGAVPQLRALSLHPKRLVAGPLRPDMPSAFEGMLGLHPGYLGCLRKCPRDNDPTITHSSTLRSRFAVWGLLRLKIL